MSQLLSADLLMELETNEPNDEAPGSEGSESGLERPRLMSRQRAEDVVECCEFMAKDGDYIQDSESTWSRQPC